MASQWISNDELTVPWEDVRSPLEILQDSAPFDQTRVRMPGYWFDSPMGCTYVTRSVMITVLGRGN